MPTSLVRRAVGEGIGTALLLAAVVGSGIMGERLSGGNVAIALLANSLATGAAFDLRLTGAVNRVVCRNRDCNRRPSPGEWPTDPGQSATRQFHFCCRQ